MLKIFSEVKGKIVKVLKGDNMSRRTQWAECVKEGCNGRWNWAVRNFCPICGEIYKKKPNGSTKKIINVETNNMKNNVRRVPLFENKINNVKGPWEVEIPLVEECSKAPKNVIIWIDPLVKLKIDHLMKKMKNIEWLAYLTGEGYEVRDLVIPQQSVSSTTVKNIVCPDYNKLPIIGVIHSHHDMGTNFSHTDDEWINQNHDISLVVSKNNISGQVRWKTPCGSSKIIPVIIKLKMNVIMETEEFDKIINENIKKLQYVHNISINDKRSEIMGRGYPYSEIKELDFTDEKTLADELREMEESGMFDEEDK